MTNPFAFLQKKLAPAAPAATLLAPEVEVHDVTSHFTEFDLSALEVFKWVPAHMTRSERLLMFTLAFNLRPQRYLEIGTFQGGSALIVAAALDSLRSDARMVCVDPRPAIAPEHWEKLKHRTTLLTGFSPDILPEAQKAAGGPFDLVLIDGDHSFEGMMRDAEGVLPYVRPGSYLLFHDSFYHEVDEGIKAFVQRHADRVVDLGQMTREVTVHQEPGGAPVHWGGLRLLQLRA